MFQRCSGLAASQPSGRRSLAAMPRGNTVKIEAEGLEAVCFQHEIDHLDGKLFIDRISRIKRDLYTRRRKKQLRREQEEESVGSF